MPRKSLGPGSQRFRMGFFLHSMCFFFVLFPYSTPYGSFSTKYETDIVSPWNLESNNISLNRVFNRKHLIELAVTVSFPSYIDLSFAQKNVPHIFFLSGTSAVFDQRPHVQQTKWQEYLSCLQHDQLLYRSYRGHDCRQLARKVSVSQEVIDIFSPIMVNLLRSIKTDIQCGSLKAIE